MPSINLKSSPLAALLSMVAVTAVWGWTFLVVQDAIGRMPVMDFLAFRFALATLAMLLLRPRSLRRLDSRGVRRAIIIGAALSMGYIFQTYGLLYTSAAVSGFITGLNVVLTPVIAWLLLRHHIGKATWLAVALATLGLGLISLNGWSMGSGELLTLACALFFGLHIVALGRWSSSYDTYALTVLQLATVTVLCFIAAAPDGITVPPDGGVWWAIVITAVPATALAFLVQTWAQSLVSPTRIGGVMTMEPLSPIFGVALGGNHLSTRMLLGALCVLAAMLLAELKARSDGAAFINPLPQKSPAVLKD
jgi:drug/metabolite transporter (DMT)-like permease